MTKDGSNARKKTARELAAAEQIPYTEALRRIDQRAAGTSAGDEITARAGAARVPRARVTPPVAALTTDVVLIGHTGRVDSVAFHPDGRTLATGGDVTVRVWDLATRQTTAVLTGEADMVSVAFSPDGSILAAADRDGTVSLWTIATGQVTALPGTPDRVQAVAFSPDGRTLASSGTHLEHHGQGRPVAFGPDGRPSLAVSGETQPQHHGPLPSGVHTSTTTTVRLWDLATGQATTLASLPDTYGGKVLVFHPSGHILAAAAGMDRTIRLLDLATGQVTALAGHTSPIEAAAFSPDGRTLATGSSDHTVRLWDLATGQTTTTLTPHGGYVVAVAFSPDGRTLAAAVDDTVRLWDLATGQATATLFGHTEHVWSVAFSPDGHTLATGCMDKTVRLWGLG